MVIYYIKMLLRAIYIYGRSSWAEKHADADPLVAGTLVSNMLDTEHVSYISQLLHAYL